MPDHAYTRIYFSDESAANEADMVLGLVDPDRRGTLIATREETSGGPVYRFDIHLQGDNETVFFDA
jgi:protocatechuate 3,4-dioxygenase alpha subunit